MRRTVWFCAVLLPLIFLLASCAGQRQDVIVRPSIPTLLISLDGFRPDYLTRGVSPTLNALAAEGVLAPAMRPAFPSVTFPNHYTLVTGLYPDHHGLVYNIMRDERIQPNPNFAIGDTSAMADERWWDEATPIWVSARRQGIRTATMFWPGSDTTIHGLRPDYWATFDKTRTPEDRVDTVLGWLDLPPALRPEFLTLYFEHVDSAGHAYGPQSAEVTGAVALVDKALGRLVDGLKARGLYDRINLIIVSDHGMAATSRSRVIVLDDLVDISDVDIVAAGGVYAGLEPKNPKALDQLLAPHDHLGCWRKQAMPPAFHYGTNARIPAIVCVPEDGWLVMSRQELIQRSAPGKPFLQGAHGYDPRAPDMAALFLAHGPDFKAGAAIRRFDNVDVYSLLTHLTGIKPEPNDGTLDVFDGILRDRGS